jgi:hypothetical protein
MTGQLFGTNTFQLPYSQITGVRVRFNFFTGYFELSAGGMQNTDKNFWDNDKQFSPAKAPNCVSINGRGNASKFQGACGLILSWNNRSSN